MLKTTRCEPGSEAVEFSLALPFILAIFFAAVGLGQLLFLYGVLEHAAAEGARAASLSRRAADGQAAALAVLRSARLDTSAAHINVAFAGPRLSVSVAYTVRLPALKFIGLDNWPVLRRECRRLVRN